MLKIFNKIKYTSDALNISIASEFGCTVTDSGVRYRFALCIQSTFGRETSFNASSFHAFVRINAILILMTLHILLHCKFSLCIMHFIKTKLVKNIRNIYQFFCTIHLYQWWCLVGNCISLYEEELCLIPCILDLQNTYWRIDKDLGIWCWYTRSMMDIRYLICILVRWKHLREKKIKNYSSFLFDLYQNKK